jgi:hypothetical protein
MVDCVYQLIQVVQIRPLKYSSPILYGQDEYTYVLYGELTAPDDAVSSLILFMKPCNFKGTIQSNMLKIHESV